MIRTISAKALQVINNYLKLDLGGKKIVTPYFINIRKNRAELRVMAGKGDPEEIVHEAKVWAQVKGFDLFKANSIQIRKFLMNLGIGIDCSGFVVHVLNAELKSRGFNSIWHYLTFKDNSFFMTIRRLLRPVENIGANDLTNDENSIKIQKLNDIRPIDLIRIVGKERNSYHVGIIIKTEHDEKGNIKYLEYANSHKDYGDQNGVRIGKIEILNPKGDLKNQKWIDDYKGKNYFKLHFAQNRENGIRRLKIFTLSRSNY